MTLDINFYRLSFTALFNLWMQLTMTKFPSIKASIISFVHFIAVSSKLLKYIHYTVLETVVVVIIVKFKLLVKVKAHAISFVAFDQFTCIPISYKQAVFNIMG